MKRKKRLLLVSPRDFASTYGDLRHVSHLTGNSGRLLNVALPTIAALTDQSEFEIKIVDENAEAIDFGGHWDVVGLTGFPPQLFRARELSERFRRRGSLVVCGGTSVSLSPERWRSCADVLIIGEAERIWPAFAGDYLAGAWQSEYRENERPDLALAPKPDYRPMSRALLRRFGGGIVQTSRGCPFDCEFCDAIVFAGRKMRYKPIGRIIEEIEQLKALGMRYVYLADDNFGAGRKKSKAILRALADYNRRQKRPVPFLTQLTIDLAKDEEFLELAAEAGLTRVFVGLETPSIESLKETHKLQNVKTDMREGVKRFQQHGIEVLGGSVVGFDNDDLRIFRRQLEFFMELGIPSVQVYPLNAPDATPLKARMEREGRYIDWEGSAAAKSRFFSYFSSYTIVPKKMTIEQLKGGTFWLLWQLYDWDNATHRLRIFFENYERSQKKGRLAIPTGVDKLELKDVGRVLLHNREAIALLLRIVRHCLVDAEPAERRAFARMLGLARSSSHPQRWSLAVSSFLTVANTRRMLLEQAPEIAETPYPSAAADSAGEPVPRPLHVEPDVPRARLGRRA